MGLYICLNQWNNFAQCKMIQGGVRETETAIELLPKERQREEESRVAALLSGSERNGNVVKRKTKQRPLPEISENKTDFLQITKGNSVNIYSSG
jgi:hypothetical protein